MNTTSTARRLGALTFTAALAVAACGSGDSASDDAGSDDPSSTDAPDVATDDTAMDDATMDDVRSDHAMDDDAMSDMPAMAMNMGGPDVSPAEEVADAALARGEFTLLDTRPSGYDDVAGTAVIARSDDGTTVTTELTGLMPNADYVSHVHEQACSDNGGGDHFQFVDGTVEVPPNEIHLAFTSDADGNAMWSAQNDAVATGDAVAFVVHPLEFIDNKIACVDFVPDDPDAVAAAIAAGPEFDPSTIEGLEGMNMNNMDMNG